LYAKRAAELRAVIEKNNRLYYDQDAPELEDYEYDQLTRELKTIEAQFPQLVTPDSPTQHVGGTPSGKFSKVAHAVKMESLQDAFSLDELREFDQRVREAGVTPEYVVEIKIDGLSVSLEYRNGRLTRGRLGGIRVQVGRQELDGAAIVRVSGQNVKIQVVVITGAIKNDLHTFPFSALRASSCCGVPESFCFPAHSGSVVNILSYPTVLV